MPQESALCEACLYNCLEGSIGTESSSPFSLTLEGMGPIEPCFDRSYTLSWAERSPPVCTGKIASADWKKFIGYMYPYSGGKEQKSPSPGGLQEPWQYQ